ncbi:uncharacterized protein BP5553_02732 [Venustampulla echinocandica]|uniref:SWI5-dependent HO expression protein 3 n=1 Tax=Venustampulla echinocandica TaxID=2656787 RepID=A0A370TS75_9HELO|nr:uncharacterized protein BP5553_02732 [Venustampulla echinocandica]RDL38392.1 hypothetical protein BP5553_02732 [Venustampulla echinocandica]
MEKSLADDILKEFDRILAGDGVERLVGPVDVPARTLSPVSSRAMNKLKKPAPTSSNEHRSISKNSPSTIRSVASEPVRLESTPESSQQTQGNNSSEIMPHSTKDLPALSTLTSQPPSAWQNSVPRVGNGLVRTMSSEFGVTRTLSNSNLRTADDGPSNTNGNTTSPVLSPGGAAPQWSSAVGRANLGKSGRVIERLMGENDMLRRDLNIERLRAEEMRQAVKMAEGRMEALTQEHEGKLHEAAINKTLLKRKERQVDDLKAQIDGEKRKANNAMESERTWRDAMEKLEEESKRKVEEAQTIATLMEGRNNTMTGHWREQGEEVQRAINKHKKVIEVIVERRISDDKRINLLQIVCDQRAAATEILENKNAEIQAAFDEYKRVQEEGLADIKRNAREREERQEAIIEESQRVLGELKWALGVQKNLRDP